MWNLYLGSIQIFFQNYLTPCICLILAGAVLGLLFVFLRLLHERRAAWHMIRELEYLRNSRASLEEVSSQTQDTMTPLLVMETMVLGERPFVFRNRLLVQEFPSLLTRPGRWIYVVPTLLTMLGIWGTFLGVSMGLAQSKLAGSRGTQELIAGSHRLFLGMETAFDTSLWGMGAAILVVVFAGFVQWLFRKYSLSLERRLRQCCMRETPGVHLSRMHQELQHLNQQMAELLLHSRQSTAEPDLVTPLRMAISEMVVQVDDLLERREGEGASMDDALSQVRAFQQKQG
ncbi:MAG: hypothetical protein EP343_28470 [Deltaproteobacteria bacterium]|nr:MAG: hypothetical protein EP343_28470 [Deltaproteobacteria bacterium]